MKYTINSFHYKSFFYYYFWSPFNNLSFSYNEKDVSLKKGNETGMLSLSYSITMKADIGCTVSQGWFCKSLLPQMSFKLSSFFCLFFSPLKTKAWYWFTKFLKAFEKHLHSLRQMDILLWFFNKIHGLHHYSPPSPPPREKEKTKTSKSVTKWVFSLILHLFPTLLPSPTLAQIQTCTKKQTNNKQSYFRIQDIMLPQIISSLRCW